MLIELSMSMWLVVILAAFFCGILHGATGMAGGLVMTAILTQIIGIKAAIPVMTVGLILSQISRAYLYWINADWKIVKRVLISGLPTLILGSYAFSLLSPITITAIFVTFLIISLPIKYYARNKNIKTSPKTLSVASVFWGALAGNVIGPSFFLAPFILGIGISRLTFVGTMAMITTVMNFTKIVVFSSTALMTPNLLTLGIIVGVLMIPGNWIGKIILNKIDDKKHLFLIDFLTILVIINFIYLLYDGLN